MKQKTYKFQSSWTANHKWLKNDETINKMFCTLCGVFEKSKGEDDHAVHIVGEALGPEYIASTSSEDEESTYESSDDAWDSSSCEDTNDGDYQD